MKKILTVSNKYNLLLDYLTVLLIISIGFSQGSRLEYQFQGIIKSSRHTLVPRVRCFANAIEIFGLQAQLFHWNKVVVNGDTLHQYYSSWTELRQQHTYNGRNDRWWNGFRFRFTIAFFSIRKNELCSTINRDQNILSHDNLLKKIIDELI